MDPGAEGVQSTNKFRVTASGEVTVWFTQRREGREKDNFLIFFFAALRLCVIKNSRNGDADTQGALI
jgi:hypothetical protein